MSDNLHFNTRIYDQYDDGFMCPECGGIFDTQEELDEHLQEIENKENDDDKH